MLNLPNFDEIYNSYHNRHKFYTYEQLTKKYLGIENNAYMFINEDDYKNTFVIGQEHNNTHLWFTTKDILQTIQINNIKKMRFYMLQRLNYAKMCILKEVHKVL